MKWESDSLAHYGIKGQQWGVRRFQNEDGSLTPEGKERYYDSGDSEKQKKTEEPKSSETQSKPGWGDSIGAKNLAEVIFPGIKKRRIEKAKKEIEKMDLQDRFDDRELDHYSKCKNGQFRKQVLNDMKKNPKLFYRDAYRQRTWKNLAISTALSVALPTALLAAPSLIKKTKDWWKRTTVKKLKNGNWDYQAKESDYKIT